MSLRHATVVQSKLTFSAGLCMGCQIRRGHVQVMFLSRVVARPHSRKSLLHDLTSLVRMLLSLQRPGNCFMRSDHRHQHQQKPKLRAVDDMSDDGTGCFVPPESSNHLKKSLLHAFKSFSHLVHLLQCLDWNEELSRASSDLQLVQHACSPRSWLSEKLLATTG